MHAEWILSLPEALSVSRGPDGAVALSWCGRSGVLRGLPPALAAALEHIVYPGKAFAELASPDPAALLRGLNALCPPGLLRVSVPDGDRRLVSLQLLARTFRMTPVDVAAGSWLLSRFAYQRRFGRDTVLETPLNAARLVLHDPRVAALVHRLGEPHTTAQLCAVTDLPQEQIAAVVELMAGAGFLTAVTPDGTPAEDQRGELQSWEFHDLLFHARSRQGRHDAVVGNTYPMAGVCPPLPALKPVAAEAWIELFRPDLAELEARDPPLVRVMEDRRSLREYGSDPISVAQLGEFLFRTVRLRDVWEYDNPTHAGPVPVAISSRPYPSGGALYPIEVYPVVRVCQGLEAGLYHYDPEGHRLARLAPRSEDLDKLLDDAAQATAMPRDAVQVLLVLTARFGRVAWKYSGLSYALILKDLGGLFQNMYLAATAMGLAPCAIGVGDSDRFARASAIDYYREGSVGEFVLGSRK
jgi:SagB-type dehydrogenase family enzyme